MTRTSATHPLYINEIAIPDRAGTIGLTLCPGKHDPHAMTGPWQRDLDTDIAAIAAWGARAVVTLIEDHEFELLRVTGLGRAVKAHGMAWHHLPICDTHAPDGRFLATWPLAEAELLEQLRHGKVLIHCRGGLGRAGTVAALLLMAGGLAPADAMARVRAARPGAIETEEQERFLLGGSP